MALFVLGDTHLSLGGSKPMDVFPGWNGYVERLEANWRKLVKPEDTIVLAGDISWAMRLTDTRRDFEFLQQLPGQKLIMKGNHDYWWTTANKMNAYLKAEGFDTLHILHNNSYSVEGYAICGTRGWLFDVGEPHDEKVMNREIGRLKMSLDAAEPGLEKLVPAFPARVLRRRGSSSSGLSPDSSPFRREVPPHRTASPGCRRWRSPPRSRSCCAGYGAYRSPRLSGRRSSCWRWSTNSRDCPS